MPENESGLGFPDNFFCIFGFKRVLETDAKPKVGECFDSLVEDGEFNESMRYLADN